MSPQEMEKLLGGYATDTLTEEERRALFEAALGNQELFDALADEQTLRELLQDPAARTQLLGLLREDKPSPMARIGAWLRRPSVLALASAVAAGIVVIAVMGPSQKMPRPAEVAMYKAPEATPPPAQAPSEARAPEPKPADEVLPPRRAEPAKQQKPERDQLAALPDQRQAAGGESNPIAQSQAADTARPAAPAPQAAPSAPAAPPPPVTVTSALPAAAPAPAEARKELSKDASTVNARDLYYASQTPATSGFVEAEKAATKASKRRESPRAFGNSVGRMSAPPVSKLAGLRYSIMKQNPDGTFADVDPAGVFAPGDALRIRFETNQSGTLAVMERQANGTWSLRMSARMREGEPVFMPAESTINVRAAGELHFFVRFSRVLQPAARMDQVTPTPALAQDKAANAVYVVNRLPAPGAAVEFELTILGK
jgi:hypothetical protein